MTATATGCGPFTYQWYIGDTGNTASPTGTNSSSFTTPTLQSTTHYWVRVTDSMNASANSNTAIVTVSGPLPTPGTLRAWFDTSGFVAVFWGASLGADHYQLQRLDHGVWSTFNVYSTSAQYTLPAGTTYVFRVRAVDASGGSASSYTNSDLATTITFATISNVTRVAFSHFDQILTAVNSIRLANNDGPLTWRQILDLSGYTSVAVPASGARVNAKHVLALRNAMNAALGSVQVAAPTYTDSGLTSEMFIKAVHITDLQLAAQ